MSISGQDITKLSAKKVKEHVDDLAKNKSNSNDEKEDKKQEKEDKKVDKKQEKTSHLPESDQPTKKGRRMRITSYDYNDHDKLDNSEIIDKNKKEDGKTKKRNHKIVIPLTREEIEEMKKEAQKDEEKQNVINKEEKKTESTIQIESEEDVKPQDKREDSLFKAKPIDLIQRGNNRLQKQKLFSQENEKEEEKLLRRLDFYKTSYEHFNRHYLLYQYKEACLANSLALLSDKLQKNKDRLKTATWKKVLAYCGFVIPGIIVSCNERSRINNNSDVVKLREDIKKINDNLEYAKRQKDYYFDRADLYDNLMYRTGKIMVIKGFNNELSKWEKEHNIIVHDEEQHVDGSIVNAINLINVKGANNYNEPHHDNDEDEKENRINNNNDIDLDTHKKKKKIYISRP